MRLTHPSELGTPVYRGKFNKEVIPGGYDMRGEKNSDTIKWIPAPRIQSQKYTGNSATVEEF